MNIEDDVSISDIVNFLVTNTYHILRWRLIEAKANPSDYYTSDSMKKIGLPKNYKHYDQDELQKIVDLTTPLIESAQHTKKITAETVADIMKLMKTGKITIDEAYKLIRLLDTQMNVEIQQEKHKIKMKTVNVMQEMLKNG
jgi:hypothetical protein